MFISDLYFIEIKITEVMTIIYRIQYLPKITSCTQLFPITIVVQCTIYTRMLFNNLKGMLKNLNLKAAFNKIISQARMKNKN